MQAGRPAGKRPGRQEACRQADHQKSMKSARLWFARSQKCCSRLGSGRQKAVLAEPAQGSSAREGPRGPGLSREFRVIECFIGVGLGS